jgi:hypothetical protein
VAVSGFGRTVRVNGAQGADRGTTDLDGAVFPNSAAARRLPAWSEMGKVASTTAAPTR